MNRKYLTIVLAAVILAVSGVQAATIDILWYTGGIADGAGYETTLNGLVAQAAANTAGNTWNITYWAGGATPGGSFDALVVGSREGFWDAYPDYTDLGAAVGGGGIVFGDRIMVSGQDADWHYINNPGHSDNASFNSSQGFLIDAVNWAGSGTGMGAVFMATEGAADPNALFSGLGTRNVDHGDVVDIPPAYAAFPINEGLTSAGLSDWGSSHHDVWTGWDASLWTAINTTTDYPDGAVTLVSAQTAGGGTGGDPIPEPGTLLLFGAGLVGSGLRKLRRRK